MWYTISMNHGGAITEQYQKNSVKTKLIETFPLLFIISALFKLQQVLILANKS